VTAFVLDNNDTASIILSSVEVSVKEEGKNLGYKASYSMKLGSDPDLSHGLNSADYNVTVTLSGEDQDFSYTPKTLVFTGDNWNVPQVVQVSAIDEEIAEYVESGVISHSAAGLGQYYQTAWRNSNGMPGLFVATVAGQRVAINTVDVIIHDDDTSGVQTDKSAVNVTEGGVTDSYGVHLTSAPLADVTVAVAGTSQVTVSPTQLLFTTGNWAAYQAVTVTAVNDLIDENTETHTIIHSVSSDDVLVNQTTGIENVDATVFDNDHAGVMMQKNMVDLRENGISDTYSIKLETEPTAVVTVHVRFTADSEDGDEYGSYSDGSYDANGAYYDADGSYGSYGSYGDEGSNASNADIFVTPARLTFDSTNWNQYQTLEVVATADDIAESTERQTVRHTTRSQDSFYNGNTVPYHPSNYLVVNVYDKVAFTANQSTVAPYESGSTDSYSVILNSEPRPVAINSGYVLYPNADSFVAESTPATDFSTNGKLQVSGLRFESQLSAMRFGIGTMDRRAVTATLRVYMLTTGDSGVGGSGIAVRASSSLVWDGSALAIYDAGEGNSSRFSQVAHALENVTLHNPAYAGVSLPLTDGHWLEFDVTDALNQAVISSQSEISFAIYGSTPTTGVTTFASSDNANVNLKPYITVVESATTVNVKITTFPLVVYTGRSDPQVTVNPTTLTFSAANWATPQVVIVSAINDDIDESQPYYNHTAKIEQDITGSNDADYVNNAKPSNITAFINDDDTATIILSKTLLTVLEGVYTHNSVNDSYTIVLSSDPIADVTVTVSAASQLVASPTTLVFSAADWNMPRTVQVRANLDVVDEQPTNYTITHSATSADHLYNGNNLVVEPTDTIITTVHDNDVAFVLISKASTAVEEGAAQDTYEISLQTKPTADVTVSATGDADVLVQPVSLTFTPATWDTKQTVTLTAINDDIDELPELHTVTHAATSSDPFYEGAPLTFSGNVSVNVTDNDLAGITLSKTATSVTEQGSTDFYTVKLNSDPDVTHGVDEPSCRVTIHIRDTHDVSVSPNTLVFTSSNWNLEQQVDVVAKDDDVDEETESQILTQMSLSAGSYNYNGTNAEFTNNGQVAVTVFDDNDHAAIILSKSEVNVQEGTSNDTYTVVLQSDPDVSHGKLDGSLEPGYRVTVSISGTEDVTVQPSSLTFTSADWNQPQTVLVVAVNDPIDEQSIETHILGHTSASGTSKYTLDNAQFQASSNITAYVQDDTDKAGVTISCEGTATCSLVGGQLVAVAEESGNTQTYTVVLDSEPVAPVDVITEVTESWRLYNDEDFERGIEGWSGAASSTECGAFTRILGGAGVLGGGDVVSKIFNLNQVPHTKLRIEMDFIKIDSWTGETAFVYIDSEVPSWSAEMTYATGTQQCGQSHPNWNEASSHIDITLPHESNSLNVTIRTSLDQGAENEAWGIDNVKVYLFSGDVRVSPTKMRFGPSNWTQPQTVTVYAMNDFLAEPVEDHIVKHYAYSGDPNYNAGNTVRTPGITTLDFETTKAQHATISDVVAQVVDNDFSGIRVNASMASSTAYTDHYEVNLRSQPFFGVTVAIGGTTELAVTPSYLYFSNTNWSDPQTVTVSTISPTNATLKNNGQQCPVTGTGTTLASNDPAAISHEAKSVDVAYSTSNATYNLHPSPLILNGGTALEVVNVGTLSLTQCSYTVSEHDDSLIVEVQRFGGSEGTVSVDYSTTPGTAAANTDYSAVTGTLTFADGELTKTFTIPVIDDDLFETPDEMFTVHLSGATNNANIGVKDAVVTITDDLDNGCLNFITANYEVSESAGSMTVVLQRGNQSSGSLIVDYTTETHTGAASPADYLATSGTLTLADGVTSAQFDITIYNDSYIENPNEIIGLKISNPLQYDPSGKAGGAGCVGDVKSPSDSTPLTIATATLTIMDDGDLKWEALSSHLDAVYTWDTNMLTFTNNFVVPPTSSPTPAPTDSPTPTPTDSPTSTPTSEPTNSPTAPTTSPTKNPTNSPTESPTTGSHGSYGSDGSYSHGSYGSDGSY
jgi:hypothetical protein